jgi:hypothetical protein
MAEIPPEIEGRGGTGGTEGSIGSPVTEIAGIPESVAGAGSIWVAARTTRPTRKTAREVSVELFIVVPFVSG